MRLLLTFLRNVNLTRSFLVPFLLICVSCATSIPAGLAPDGADKCIVAIRVKKSRLLLGPESPSLVYFVRVEADGQHRQPSVLEANYVKGGYAYLVNASPGRYAAVGAMTIRVSSSPTYQHQFNATTGTIEMVNPTCCDHKYEEYWYFPEAMVDETVVTVGPSRMVFMGEFKLSGDLWLGDADDMQTHYSDLLGGSKPGNAVTKLLYNVSNEFIAEYRKDESEKATQRFLKSSESLAELGWRAVIERASAEDGDNEGVTEQPDQQNGNK